jgi:hypothetical protein
MKHACGISQLALVGLAVVAVLLTFGVADASAETWLCVPTSTGKTVTSGGTGKEASCEKGATPVWQPLAAEQETLQKILPDITYIASGVGGKPTIRLSAVNVQIVNGAGSTATTNGAGNLVIGYNEEAREQTGSHNLILGGKQQYTSYGGILAGFWNTINKPFASITGGYKNTASNDYASVSGGSANLASGEKASVSGGFGNEATVEYASVSGGSSNAASGVKASVSSGSLNTASGEGASISGGGRNTASGEGASISGGYKNAASKEWASVSGGEENKAAEAYTSITGGAGNETIGGTYASVQGGRKNSAAGRYSSIFGGKELTALGEDETLP